MKEQVNQKQEAWLGQALESTAREYGFLCLNHEVQWNAEGSWPEQLTLWLEKQEDEKERWPEDIAEHTTESTTGDAVDNSVGTVGISSVNPVKPVTGRDSDIEKNMQGEAYYEPSELRPLHQALQMVWQLEEGQIMLYWQR